MTALAEDLARMVGVKAACEALNVPRSQVYRARQGVSPRPGPTPARALSEEERSGIPQTLNSERFAECAPRQVYAALLDEGVYLCSLRTMYRGLEADDEVRERRDPLRHPSYRKPELLARAPNQVWSWDITKLRGPVKWTYVYLYVLLDIYSRYAVGWLLADRESAALAEVLVEESCRKQGVIADQLTLHADNGG